MSRRGEDKTDSPAPIRRSSRISLGQNLTSSPAPMGIRTRRGSASSASEEKISIEPNSSPKEKRKTRRASADEDPKPAPVRSRRGSISKKTEEEKTSIPSSPGRRSTRLSSSSPSLEAPARRTRRSSQETETVGIPAGRTTGRSSTGIQESTIEEIVEKAKPVTRRRRSSSIDELEENTKTENVRSKTKKLFNDENYLEPIEEQEHEMKVKEVAEKKQESILLEVIQETSYDDECGKIIEDLNEALGENSGSNKSISKELKIEDSTKQIVTEKNDLTEEQSLEASNESLNKTIKDIHSESYNKEKEQSITKEITVQENMSTSEDTTSKEKSPLENSTDKVSPVENPVVQQRNVLEIGEDSSLIVTLNHDKIHLENKINETDSFSSPGSDKENTSINIKRKRLSIKKIEENSRTEVGLQNGFAIKETPNKSICEPMDVDDDEDEVFLARSPTKNQTPTKLSPNRNIREESIKTGSIKDDAAGQNQNVVSMNCSVKENDHMIEESFSHVNSSPDKDSSLLVDESTISRLSQSSSMLSENKLPSTDNVDELGIEDCGSDTSIKLVDTDEEEERVKISTFKQEDKLQITSETSTNNTSIFVIPDSELNESLLDKSFESTKNNSLADENNETEDEIEIMDTVEKKEESTNHQIDSEEIALRNESMTSAVLQQKSVNQDSIILPDHPKEDPKTLTRQSGGNQESDRLVPSDPIIKSSSSVEKNTVDIVSNAGCEENTEVSKEETIEIKRRSSSTISLGSTSVQNKSASIEILEITHQENIEGIPQSPHKSIEADSKIPVQKSMEGKNDSFTSHLESQDSFNIQDMPVILCADNNSELNLSLGDSQQKLLDESKIEIVDEHKLNISKTDRESNKDGTLRTESTQEINNSNENINSKETSLADELSVDDKIHKSDDHNDRLEEKTCNISKTDTSPGKKIILQKIEVVKIIDVGIPNIIQLDSNVQDSRLEGDNGNNKISANQEQKLINDKSRSLRSSARHSLPNNRIQNGNSEDETNPNKPNDRILNTRNSSNTMNNQIQNARNEQQDDLTKSRNEIEKQNISDASPNRSFTRHSLTKTKNDDNIESKDVEGTTVEEKPTKSRLSNKRLSTTHIPSETNKFVGEIHLDVEQTNVEENSNTCTSSIQTPAETNDSEDEIHLISSSDDEEILAPKIEENCPLQKKCAARNSREKTENEDCKISEIETKSNKRKSVEARDSSIDDKYTLLKSESEGTRKKPRVSCEKTSRNEKKEVEPETKQSLENKKGRRTEETIKIMHRSGIDVEDVDNLMDGYHESNSFIDDMAEEVEDSLSEEESDENEIIDIGESVLTSDSKEESSEEDYDLDDSFIDNDEEEEELLSGEEEFLKEKVGPKSKTKNKKFKRIIRPSSTSEDEIEEVTKKENIIKPTASFKSPITESPQVEELRQVKELIQTNNEKFEGIVDSILKLNPAECSTPKQSVCEAINLSKNTESSVILQETCSVGAAKSRVIIEKIQGVVDVFCKNINDPEGDISLNVSLNYKPPSNTTSARNSLNLSFGTQDLHGSNKNSPNKSSRLSLNENRNTTLISPQKAPSETVQMEEQIEKPDSENENINTQEEEHKNELPIIVVTEVSKKKKKTKRKRSKKGLISSLELKELPVEELFSSEEKEKNSKSNPEIRQNECKISNSKNTELKYKTTKEITTTEVHTLPLETKNKKRKDHSKIRNKIVKLSTSECDQISAEVPVKKTLSKAKKVEFKEIKDVHDTRTAKNSEKQMKRSRDVSEPPIERKKVKYDESVEVKKKVKPEKREGSTQKKHKKGTNQNNALIASKTSEHDEKRSQFRTSDIIDLKLKKSEIVRSKHKDKKGQEYGEWDEEDILVKPSSANNPSSGFNLEKYVERDFKNRMIYDSFRNKREPAALSRRQKKSSK